MATPIQTAPTPIGEFQSHFGSPPGSSDTAGECKKWERLCAELLAEREKLRQDLAEARTERDDYLRAVYALLRKEDTPPDFTREEVEEAMAHLHDRPTIRDLIAEFEREIGSSA